MAAAGISPGQALKDIEQGVHALEGVNSVASGQGITGQPEQQAAAAAGATGSSGWSLNIGNTSGLLTRFLKVVIGGFLLLAGIMKLTNTDEKALGALGALAGRLPA